MTVHVNLVVETRQCKPIVPKDNIHVHVYTLYTVHCTYTVCVQGALHRIHNLMVVVMLKPPSTVQVGFGKGTPSKMLWVDGVDPNMLESTLERTMSKYGKVSFCIYTYMYIIH